MPSATGPAGPLVCVDFDDTLVENQAHFEQAASDLARLLRRELGVTEEAVHVAFRQVDAAHHHLGRNRNRFLLTLCATYAALGGGDAVPLRLLPELAAIAAHPYDAPVAPLPGTVAALERLNAAFPGAVYLVTAGDRVVQAGRVQRSGLSAHFARIHVVADKTAAIFAGLGRGRSRLVMIGNSPRSDLAPARAAGFEAIHVQAPTWALDDGPLPEGVPSCPSFPAAVDLLLGGWRGDGQVTA